MFGPSQAMTVTSMQNLLTTGFFITSGNAQEEKAVEMTISNLFDNTERE